MAPRARAQPQHNRGRSSNRTTTPPASRHIRSRSPSAEAFPETPDASDDDDDEADTSAPPVIVSPIKRRANAAAPTINKMSDLDVWGMTDQEIIDAGRTTWRSDAYDHYDVTLQRKFSSNNSPRELMYVFTCRTCPKEHKPLLRPRSKTGEGTSNLVRTMNICLKAQGITPGSASCTDDTSPVLQYSQAAHRALIALRCAKNARPFNSVNDEDYRAEVQMLRPGTILPQPITVSRDINSIYLELSRHVRQYFIGLNSAIHLVLDGWTSPLVSSYLGLVVIWYENGLIHRAILEFIRLTQKHDGRYLADVVAQCLKRFGLEKQLFSICMDNASNCDKLAEILVEYLPDFRGQGGRLRCLAHIFNLVAKVFISFFFKKPKAKKVIRIAGGARSGQFMRRGQQVDASDDEDIVVEPGDDTESEPDEDNNAANEEAQASVEEVDDEGQAMHNERVAKTIQQKAINYMDTEKNITLDPQDVKMALQIFPRISGLARRVHDSSTLKEKFDKIVTDTESLEGNRRALIRRVPTRWNSDLDCLLSHFYFREVIEQLTSIPSLKLKKYRLSAEQWKMAEDVREILLLFDEVTKIFSTAEVPLIVDVIPTLEQLRDGLTAARDDKDNDVSTVVQVACQAGIFLVDKYSIFAEDCDIYLIAIVMCPDRKLLWFKEHGRTPRQIKDIEKKVYAAWNESYSPEDEEDTDHETSRPTRSRYAKPLPAANRDRISTYLKEPILATSTIKEAGGYIKFWHQASISRPNLARMASDYCSAPATSVDAERAFSTGRRQVNFMQSNMNSQTFKAQMAVGSWARSPLYPGFKIVRDVIDKDIDLSKNPFISN